MFGSGIVAFCGGKKTLAIWHTLGPLCVYFAAKEECFGLFIVGQPWLDTPLLLSALRSRLFSLHPNLSVLCYGASIGLYCDILYGSAITATWNATVAFLNHFYLLPIFLATFNCLTFLRHFPPQKKALSQRCLWIHFSGCNHTLAA